MSWREVRVGELLSLEYGKSLLRATRVSTGSVPVAGSNGPDGRHDTALVDGPGIVVGRKGSAGKVTWFDSSFWPIDTTYFVKHDPGVTTLRWLYYLLRQIGLDRLNKTTGVPGLNRADAYAERCLLPPPSEQRRIVEMLDQAEALRKLRREADAKAARILPALFLKMFGDPATNPMGWPIKRLGDLADAAPEYGANASACAPANDKPRYVRITDIQEDGTLSAGGAVSLNLTDWQRYLLAEGDVLFARSGNTVGKTYLYRNSDGECAFAGYLIRFQFRSGKIEPWFVFGLTRTGYYRAWVQSHRRVAGQPNINGREYASLEVPKPPPELQARFGEVARSVESVSLTTETVGQRLENTFALLLRRAFSGQLTAEWRQAHMQELLIEMQEQARLLNLRAPN